MRIIRICVLVTSLVLALAPGAQASGRPRIGVPKFDFSIESVGEGIADILTRELVKCGRFSVIERAELESLLTEVDFQQSEYVEQETAVPLGEIKGVDYLLIGKITAFGYGEREKSVGGAVFGDHLGIGGVGAKTKKAHAQFDIRLVEVRTGKVVFAESAEGFESKKGLTLLVGGSNWAAGLDFQSSEFRESMIGKATYKAMAEVLKKLYEKFPHQGVVLVRDGDTLITSIGEISGVGKGDILEVFRVTELKDEEGEVVWKNEEKVGTARVIEFQGENCMATIITGRNEIEQGMLVRPEKQYEYLPEEAGEEEGEE